MVEAGYDNKEKSELFFKLHQLQTGSWGATSIGRVTQTFDLPEVVDEGTAVTGDSTNATATAGEEMEKTDLEPSMPSVINGSLVSEVDLIVLPLTSVPLVGFWKLLPTFGGCVATNAAVTLTGEANSVLEIEVETTVLKAVEDVPLLPLAGKFFEGKSFPTADVVKKILGKVPIASQTVRFVDEDLRIMGDKGGQIYIYSR
ncbi:unnamed protein product, partial [Discosporangium mesarthrocarpum]